MKDNKFTCLTIEDDMMMSSILEDLIGKNEKVELLEQFDNGVEGIRSILSLKPDFIFLDINMPGIDGLEMFELSDYKPLVIIVSGESTFKKECEEIPEVIAFLDKPINELEFDKAMELVIKRCELG